MLKWLIYGGLAVGGLYFLSKMGTPSLPDLVTKLQAKVQTVVNLRTRQEADGAVIFEGDTVDPLNAGKMVTVVVLFAKNAADAAAQIAAL